MESIFQIVCSALSRRFWMPVLLAVAVPLARTQTSAPGIGVLGNRIVATTAGTLGLHSVTVGETLDLRGVNFSGSEYTCTTGKGFWDVPAGNQTTINHMRDDWHANVIRLPLNEICWLGINGAPPATSGGNYQNAMGTFTLAGSGLSSFPF